jgi:uncharacterized membrane protein YgaE (UPF0421/DUF939 family)
LIGLGVYVTIGPSWYATGLGIVAVIYACNRLGKPASVSIACIVLIAIMTNLKEVTPVAYAANRVLDTLIGIVIAIIVNRAVPGKNRDLEEKEGI